MRASKPAKPTYYRCLNCPQKPQFSTKAELDDHWKATHSVNQIVTEEDPWGMRESRTKKWIEGPDV